MDDTRTDTEKEFANSLATALDNFHQEQRAYLISPGR